MEKTNERGSLSNDLVLEALTELVDCPNDLRSFRAVNMQWLRNCNKKAIQLSTFQGLKGIISPAPDGLGYDRNMENSHDAIFGNIQRLKVDDQVDLLEHVDVIDFFQRLGNNIKFLSFETAEEQKMSALHLKFLENVLYTWCLNLEELKLVGLFQTEIDVSDKKEDDKMIPLKKLVLDYTKTVFFAEDALTSIIRKIILRAEKLESFVYIGYKLDPFLHFIPIEMMRQMNLNARNITSLELVDVSIEERSLALITQAGWPLRRFVYEGRPSIDILIRHLNLFLDAHTNTLTYLHFKVHWFSYFDDENVELKVHTLSKLQVLKVSVQNINVGSSGLLGNLENLKHFTIWGSTAQDTVQHDIETMFRGNISKSLKSLVLDETYARFLSTIPQHCPNITDLEIRFKVKNVDAFIRDLHIMVGDNRILEDLMVTALFEDFDIYNDEFGETMVAGLFRHPFRVLKVATSHDMKKVPWLLLEWIEDGLLHNENTYFRIEFKRFLLRDDELDMISRLLSNRANFVTFAECKVSSQKTGGVLDISQVTFFKDNVGEVISKIIEDAQKQERVVTSINYDPFVD